MLAGDSRQVFLILSSHRAADHDADGVWTVEVPSHRVGPTT